MERPFWELCRVISSYNAASERRVVVSFVSLKHRPIRPPPLNIIRSHKTELNYVAQIYKIRANLKVTGLRMTVIANHEVLKSLGSCF